MTIPYNVRVAVVDIVRAEDAASAIDVVRRALTKAGFDVYEDVEGAMGPAAFKSDTDENGEPWCNHDAVAVHNGVCECGVVVTP